MANENSIGLQIRLFFRDLFGSRLSDHLQDELYQLRGDYEVRLRERESYIADLKAENNRLIAKVAEYELVLIPLSTGGLMGPKKPAVTFEEIPQKNSWQVEQERFYREQEEAERQEAERKSTS